MKKSNLAYKTENLGNFFRSHRTTWDDLYPSEKHVIEMIRPAPSAKVLDMGCACGGLGRALNQRFGIVDYTGVDINAQCIEIAPIIFPQGKFYKGDFLDVQSNISADFDVAFSLSCADWNVRTEELLDALTKKIKPGGNLILSCRATNRELAGGLVEGQQSLLFYEGGEKTEEWAPYKIYRLERLLDLFNSIAGVGKIYGYGYCGAIPQSVTGIPFAETFFIVFALTIGSQDCGKDNPKRLILDISPPDLLRKYQ